MGTATKYLVSDRVKPSFVIVDIWAVGTLTLRAERQSAQMSKITNDGLTRSGTGCCTRMATVGVKELKVISIFILPGRCANPHIMMCLRSGF